MKISVINKNYLLLTMLSALAFSTSAFAQNSDATKNTSNETFNPQTIEEDYVSIP